MSGEFQNARDKKYFIIQEAVGLMDDAGLKNVTIQDICKVAGISVGTFYHYFPSKNSIITEMYYYMDREFVEREQEFFSYETSYEALMAFVKCYASYIARWGTHANLLIIRNSLQDPQAEQSNRKLYDILYRLVVRGQEQKDVTGAYTPTEINDMLFAQLRGHSYAWAKNPEYDVEPKMNLQISLFLKSICI